MLLFKFWRSKDPNEVWKVPGNDFWVIRITENLIYCIVLVFGTFWPLLQPPKTFFNNILIQSLSKLSKKSSSKWFFILLLCWFIFTQIIILYNVSNMINLERSCQAILTNFVPKCLKKSNENIYIYIYILTKNWSKRQKK